MSSPSGKYDFFKFVKVEFNNGNPLITKNHCLMLVPDKESLYTGEPMRQQKNLVMLGYRVEFD